MFYSNTMYASFNLDVDKIKDLFFVLEKGIFIKIDQPFSLRTFICKKIGFQEEYLDNKIKTIFLNGKVVDDINSIFVKNGCSLAFSAAMPGLVGAALSREGKYASMRKNISFNNKKVLDDFKTSSYVCIKIFNSIIKDYGAILLKSGVIIKGTTFVKVINKILKIKKIDKYFININENKINIKDINVPLIENNFVHLSIRLDDVNFT